jgi:hypothetical protein
VIGPVPERRRGAQVVDTTGSATLAPAVSKTAGLYSNPNPNAGDAVKGKTLLPNVSPEFRQVVASAVDYSAALHNLFDSADVIGKGLKEAPQAYSFATISYMPDQVGAGLISWPGINPDSLRKINKENIAPRMVINLRKADIRRYAQHSTHPWHPGWRIKMREADAKVTTEVERRIKDAERFIINGARDISYDAARQRDAALLDPFSQFLSKAVEDIFTYDGWAIWTDTDSRGGVTQFCSIPAGNIRLARPGVGYKNDPSKFAALIDETGNPITAFTRDELVWRVLNPRTDPEVAGYGFPYAEQAVRVIQAFQNAIDLNADTFVRNGTPNGVLLLKGDYWNQDQIDLMQREWNNMKKGITKAWGVPVIAVPEDGDITVVPFNDLKGHDVRYRDHMNMMIGAYCIVTCTPVRRLGLFASGHNVDNEPTKGESVDMQGVDDPGLPPLLEFIAETITQYLIAPNWPELCFKFGQVDPKNDAREYEARRLSRTWGESRREGDQPDLTSLVKGGEDSEDMKLLAELMSLCPEDPAKNGTFQALATKILELRLGPAPGEEGGDDGTTGSPFTSKIDPGEARTHGHQGGVRRNSRKEAASAGGKKD